MKTLKTFDKLLSLILKLHAFSLQHIFTSELTGFTPAAALAVGSMSGNGPCLSEEPYYSLLHVLSCVQNTGGPLLCTAYDNEAKSVEQITTCH